MKTAAPSACQIIASEILRLVPCDRIAFVVPRRREAGYRIASVHPESASFPDFLIPASGSCTARVVASRHGELLSGIGEEMRYAEEEPLYRAGIRDAAFVPLFLGGELLAVAIVGRTEVHSLEPRSVRCLEKVSGLLAAAWAASRESQGRAGWPSGVVRHAREIVQEEDLDRACRSLMEAVRENTPCRRAVLTLLDPELKAYQWFFSGLTDTEIDQYHRRPISAEECRGIFQRRDAAAPVRCDGTRSLIPLIGSRERPLGFLALDFPEEGSRPAEDVLAPLEILAGLMSLALERQHLSIELKSERNRLQKSQEQLVHAEKLSAIGQLVSGVAHELNNPLAGVVGFAELVQRNNADPRCARDLQRIVSEAQRCQRIVQNLLNFARRTKSERRPMNLNEIIENVLDLRSYQIRLDNVKVRMELSPDLPPTLGDYHQIQQVFLNIINNAHQAMQEVEGERILTIRTRVEGERIVVSFEDTGPGISSVRLARVFEPFFTTKEAGKGTGLGLSISRNIVQEHGGEIEVESTVGQGTRFTVEVPIRAPEEPPSAPSPSAAKDPGRSSQRILVVDDEEVIVDLLNEVLASAGHTVETARDGEQALQKILSGPYDAVISDLKMPGMDGAGLYDAVCRERPEMSSRFIFSTGDLASPATQEFFHKTHCPYLMKPFDLKSVRETVDRLFSRS